MNNDPKQPVSISVIFPNGEHTMDYQVSLDHVDLSQMIMASWAIHKEIDKYYDQFTKQLSSKLVMPTGPLPKDFRGS